MILLYNKFTRKLKGTRHNFIRNSIIYCLWSQIGSNCCQSKQIMGIFLCNWIFRSNTFSERESSSFSIWHKLITNLHFQSCLPFHYFCLRNFAFGGHNNSRFSAMLFSCNWLWIFDEQWYSFRDNRKVFSEHSILLLCCWIIEITRAADFFLPNNSDTCLLCFNMLRDIQGSLVTAIS